MVVAAPAWKRTLPAPSSIASQLDPPRCTVTRRGRVYLVDGDTIEVVAQTLVLAPQDPTNFPSPPPFFPFLLLTTATTTQPLLFSSLLFLFSPPPLPPSPLLSVPCLLSLTPPRGQVTPGHRPSKHMVQLTRPSPLSKGGAGALAAWASTAWSPWKGRLGAMNIMVQAPGITPAGLAQ